MKRVFSHDNVLMVHNIKNILLQSGIACQVRNDLINSAAGEVPPTVVWPEVWIEQDADLEQAEALIDKAVHGDPAATSWRCPKCQEKNAPAFEICWNCGEERK